MNIWIENGEKRQYTDYGCSPQILLKTIAWLREKKETLVSLDLALYLFNNDILLNALLELADAGCKVTVYSIPLEGYDDKSRANIYSFKNGDLIGNFTKYEIAREIYGKIQKLRHPHFEFRIVPHMYLRSPRVKPFSRGKMPYSLHCKTFLAKCKDDSYYAGITSSNLAVRDEEKNEIAAIIQIDQKDSCSARDFFAGLYENSVNIYDFDETADYFQFPIKMRPQPKTEGLNYTAPFYYNSSVTFENDIISILLQAKRKIFVCAQHISAYNYSYNAAFRGDQVGYVTQPGFLDTVLKSAQQNESQRTQVFLLSQTYVDAEGDHGCRAPENKARFIDFAETAKKCGCHYRANKQLHSKYIVTDNASLISTSNFTPTQFIYLPDVDIPRFDLIPNCAYKGIFCEFGAYYVSRDPDFIGFLKDYSNKLWADNNTIRMF